MIDLTMEQVEGALASRSHPIIRVLGVQKLRLEAFNRVYAGLETQEERQDYLKREFGFLGNEFEGLKDFALGPTDMISVWAHVAGYDTHQRRALAGLATCAYGTRGLEGWKGASRYVFENFNFPKIETATPEEVAKIRGRFEDVKAGAADILAYLSGGYRGNTFYLASSAERGDEEKKRQLEEIRKTQAERGNPILDQASDDCSHALIALYKALSNFDESLKV